MEATYADALRSALKKGIDEQKLVDGLVAHLKAEGRMKLLPGILRSLKQKSAGDARLAPSLEVAKESDKAEAVSAAKALGIDAPKVTVNTDLISGWRARSGSTLVDRSGKKALIELYRNIITN
ncbi:MAG: hypothetical protein AAB901_02665 [Patescibacteria group bacterium]